MHIGYNQSLIGILLIYEGYDMSKQSMILKNSARFANSWISRSVSTTAGYESLGQAWMETLDSKGILHATYYRTHAAETLRAQLSKISEGKDGLIRAALLMDTTPVTESDARIIKDYCRAELGIELFTDPEMVGNSYPSREDRTSGYWSGSPAEQLSHIKRITDTEGYRVLLPAFGSGGPHIPGIEQFTPQETSFGIGTPFSHHAYYSGTSLFAGQIITTQIGHIAKGEGVTPMIIDSLKNALASTGISLNSIIPVNDIAHRDQEVVGQLVGGNTGVILESSKIFTGRFAGNIAYFEQYGPLHTHEMLRQIIGNVRQALTGGASAIILGDLKFKGQERELEDVMSMVQDICNQGKVPLYHAQGVGHGARLFPIAIGTPIALRTEDGVASLNCSYTRMFDRQKSSWINKEDSRAISDKCQTPAR